MKKALMLALAIALLLVMTFPAFAEVNTCPRGFNLATIGIDHPIDRNGDFHICNKYVYGRGNTARAIVRMDNVIPVR